MSAYDSADDGLEVPIITLFLVREKLERGYCLSPYLEDSFLRLRKRLQAELVPREGHDVCPV